MTKQSAGFVALTSGLVSVFLLGVGVSLWRTPPTAAEEAVGKGIVTLAVAVAIVFFCSMTVFLDKRDDEAHRATQADEHA